MDNEKNKCVWCGRYIRNWLKYWHNPCYIKAVGFPQPRKIKEDKKKDK